MENASKALIIAGAILLAILIIGLGIFIYGQASGTASDAGIDALSASAFNAQFESYIKEDNVSGTNALKLFDAVIADKTGRVITMKVGNETLDISNSTKINQSRNKIISTYKYKITSTRDTNGYINGITFTKQ